MFSRFVSSWRTSFLKKLLIVAWFHLLCPVTVKIPRLSSNCWGLENQLSKRTYFALCPAAKAVFKRSTITEVAFWWAMSLRFPAMVRLSILLQGPRTFSSSFEAKRE